MSTRPSLGERARIILSDALSERGMGLPDLAAAAELPLTYVEFLWRNPGKIGIGDFALLAQVAGLDPFDAWAQMSNWPDSVD